MFCDVSKTSSVPQFYTVLTLRTELSRSHQNVYVRCFVTSTDDAEVQHTERCIKDISLLCSNEDNPQFTDPVRIIAQQAYVLNEPLGVLNLERRL